jgi:hypothetical protein
MFFYTAMLLFSVAKPKTKNRKQQKLTAEKTKLLKRKNVTGLAFERSHRFHPMQPV